MTMNRSMGACMTVSESMATPLMTNTAEARRRELAALPRSRRERVLPELVRG